MLIFTVVIVANPSLKFEKTILLRIVLYAFVHMCVCEREREKKCWCKQSHHTLKKIQHT